MSKTQCHVYFEVDEAEGIVRVVAAMGAKDFRSPSR